MGKPKVKVAAPVDLFGNARYASLLSEDQIEETAKLVDILANAHKVREGMRTTTRAHVIALVASIFPRGREPTKADWIEFVNGVAEQVVDLRVSMDDDLSTESATSIADYVKKELRQAYKDVGDDDDNERELPSAGKGTGKGKPGTASSPKVKCKGLMTRVTQLVAYIETLEGLDINVAKLGCLVDAADALVDVATDLQKA